jgi:3-oxoacyl-[acyl-carrier protein] reductase
LRLENKVAIVTGAAVGIGFAIAERFVVEGAKVLLFDVDRDALEKAVSKIGRGPETVQEFCGDAAAAADARDAVALALNKFNRIDILVNNAGIFPTGRLHEITEDAWSRTMDVNLKSVYLFSKEVIPGMLARGTGKIINVSSAAGVLATRNCPLYCATKGGMNLLTKAMAVDYAPAIQVNALAPHAVVTPMLEHALAVNPGLRELILRDIPSGVFRTPKDCAAGALYLASDDADQVTGHVLLVDGGVTAFY